MRALGASRTSVATGGVLAGNWVRNPLWTRARAVPSLDLRFADNKTLGDAVGGGSLVTFTRASTGTYVGSDGVLRSAVTNLLLRSEEFDNAYWTKTNSSTTQDAIAAPNGTITAEKLLTNTTSGIHAVRRDETVLASTAYTLSFYAKPGEYTFLAINHGHTLSADYHTFFDLSNGTIGTSAAGNTATIQSVGNGWYRCSVTRTTGASQTSLSSRALACQADNVTSFVGDTASGIYLWGAQLEQSATVGEYIPTTSTINSAPRFDHNPTTGESLGLLVEEARTNLLLRSEEFNDAYWTTSVLVASNSTTSPDGVLTADLLADTVDASAQAHQVSRILSVTSGVAYTLSAYIKAGTGIGFSLGASAAGAFTVEQRVVFNAVTGVATLSLGTPTNISITPTGSGWYRCSCVITPTTTGNATIVLRLYNSAGAGFYQGDGTQNAYLWGAQLEAGSFPTSYISTTSATVTRAADVASIGSSAFTSFYNQSEGTVFADANVLSSSYSAGVLWDIGAGGVFGTTEYVGWSGTGWALGPAAAPLNVSSFVATSLPSKTASAIKANDSVIAVNGLAGGVDTSCAIAASPTTLFIGKAGWTAGNLFNGTIKRLAYWPVRLANTTLQSITTP